jgi:hypothetical protein
MLRLGPSRHFNLIIALRNYDYRTTLRAARRPAPLVNPRPSAGSSSRPPVSSVNRSLLNRPLYSVEVPRSRQLDLVLLVTPLLPLPPLRLEGMRSDNPSSNNNSQQPSVHSASPRNNNSNRAMSLVEAPLEPLAPHPSLQSVPLAAVRPPLSFFSNFQRIF